MRTHKIALCSGVPGRRATRGLLCNCAGESLRVPSHELSNYYAHGQDATTNKRDEAITITTVSALLPCYYDKNTPTKVTHRAKGLL